MSGALPFALCVAWLILMGWLAWLAHRNAGSVDDQLPEDRSMWTSETRNETKEPPPMTPERIEEIRKLRESVKSAPARVHKYSASGEYIAAQWTGEDAQADTLNLGSAGIDDLLALTGELLEVIDATDPYTSHAQGPTGRPCQTVLTYKWEDCNCGLREAEDRSGKFLTPAWLETASRLRGTAKEQHDGR